MDCTIPGTSIRPFCAAISCLSKIGKELYVDFDPFDGLSLRALNDSKSVFGNFHYEPSFFTRCHSVLDSSSFLTKTNENKNRTTTTKSSAKRKRGHGSSNRDNDGRDRNNSDESDEDDNDSERWTVRIAMKALIPIVRSRKDVSNLQLLTVRDHLAFEFHIQKMDGTTVRVLHKVGYAPANGVAAVASMDDSSELVIQPHVLATMLEPLKRSIEIAIIVNEKHKLVSSVTFSHDDLPEQPSMTSTAALTKQQASVKTEVSVKYDDLVEVHYVGFAGHNGDGCDSSDTDDGRNHGRDNRRREVSQSQQLVRPPTNLKEQVILVFTLKEFKAFLQFCSQAVVDQELQLSIQFHWGGRPMVLKTVGESFHGELFMATLDHHLLGDMRTSNTVGNEIPAPAAASAAAAGRRHNTGE